MGPLFFKRTHKPVFFILLFVSFVLLYASRGSSFSGFRYGVLSIFKPVLSLASSPSQGVDRAWGQLKALSYVQEENEKLKRQLAVYPYVKSRVLQLELENKRLRDLLHMPVPAKSVFVSGKVISDVDTPSQETFIVNIGSDQGVSVGDIALSAQGLVGYVVTAGPRVSRVLSIKSSRIHLPVSIGPHHKQVILQGDGTSFLSFLFVKDKKNILAGGEWVITSGTGGMFPAGLPVGQIVFQDGKPKVRLLAKDIIYLRLMQFKKHKAL